MLKATPNALLIFVKNPVKGNVKTRLAADVGDEKALAIYRKLLGYTREVVRPLAVDKQVWYSREVAENDEWSPQAFAKRKQQGAGLGERMQYAFRQAFAEGYQRVVIIGSDCGELTTSLLERTYVALEETDIIIGPAEDGGYYLLGMNHYIPELFQQKAWSTSSVLDQTIDDCQKLRKAFQLMPLLNDVDTATDWDRVKQKM